MSISLTSPVTGSAQTGFTSPTYTIESSQAADSNGKHWVVTALGGTQGSASANTVGFPFTFTAWIPKVFKSITPALANLTGFSKQVPKNEWVYKTTKGVSINGVGGMSQAEIITYVRIPVGAFTGTNGADDLKAMHSFHLGALVQSPTQWYNNEAAGTL